MQIQQNNTLTELRRKIQAIEMNKVVVKATEIICHVDVIFKASDGNTYYISGGRSAVAYFIYDNEECIYHLDNNILLEWLNENPKEWELDEPCINDITIENTNEDSISFSINGKCRIIKGIEPEYHSVSFSFGDKYIGEDKVKVSPENMNALQLKEYIIEHYAESEIEPE